MDGSSMDGSCGKTGSERTVSQVFMKSNLNRAMGVDGEDTIARVFGVLKRAPSVQPGSSGEVWERTNKRRNPLVDLKASMLAPQAPRAEMFAVVGQQSISMLANA